MSAWRVALMLLAGLGYACASHWLMLHHASEPWAVVALLAPLWLTALGLGASRFGGRGVVVALIIGALGLVLIWNGEAGDPNRLYVVQHAGINALLCGWFGGSLRPGRLSLIGRFAERVHPLTAAHRLYTAQVTKVWTGYFAAMTVASIAVYLLLPFAAWSLLANLVSPLLIGALFIGEYLLRYRLHPEFERTRMIDAVRAFCAAPVDHPGAPR